ncbi:E3 ubiquitin/ISG15 ligase TRIM25 isoform X3 [Conger conger]|uniref:E3 ubiquitin/ISG15 ligase TRIM25 isoform X3 n=1 Tax=Conger conger TaxID=82655 RepID=UPI002A5AED22|nr:E3 ubiquitin/ISG15 ligase TRIM25 isoform X3 [Conger conger]
MAEDMTSLLSLEEELTCSICLSPFQSPVTTPCGHNFCQDCLDLTWQEDAQAGFNCPQCRCHFATKPELKKNTVLDAVVDKFNLRSKGEIPRDATAKLEIEVAPVLCDTCMEAKACKTCLTCMASFCAEHVRPHLENPVFGMHQLKEPLSDLHERICPTHSKMMEFFCVQHVRAICSFCLQQEHKGCTFSTPEEQQVQQESELKKKLVLLDGKIEKTYLILSQMKEQQCVLKDASTNRKRELELEYKQIRELIDADELQAMKSVEKEEEAAQSRLVTLMKRFDQNIDEMKGAKDRIDGLLARTQSLAFLQASVDLPSSVAFEPYVPRLSINNKRVHLESAAALKEYLGNILKHPVDNRASLLRPEIWRSMPGNAAKMAGPPHFIPVHLQNPLFTADKMAGPPHVIPVHLQNPLFTGFHHNVNPGPPPSTKPDQKKKKPQPNRKPDQDLPKEEKPSKNNPNTGKDTAGAQPSNRPVTFGASPSLTAPAKRTELLKYGTVLKLDHRTAHKRIILSEDFTKASVSDEPAGYPDSPARFSVCSQVLCTKGFSQGRHYWEVKMTSNNFCGVGLAYNSIDRKGPASRLGRNNQSWCVEWFNVKLSAWHGSSETVLTNPSPSRVGVLLDCTEGTATFYNVADRAYPFHTFVYPFAEAVYPAFWIFSSGTAVTLCKLN